MAINVNFNGASIRKPGAYSKSQVNLSGGFPLAPTGIVAIVGEAEGGAPGASEGVQTFTSEDIASLIAKYKSGPIVDAARILIAPARDARVANGAGMIRVMKTNQSTQATLALNNAAPVALFNVKSANWGVDENLISVKVEAGTVNANARIITVQKGDVKEVLSENPYAAWLVIQYTGAGSAATLTIQSGVLATTVTGMPSDNLSISLAGKSVQQVCDIIDGHAAYTCTTTLKLANAKSAADLDPISTPLAILASPQTLRAQQKELLDIINGESALITATRVTNVEGTIAALARTFLSGGAKGASTNSNFQAAFDALLAARCNIVIPLISRDASVLAPLGLTDAASTFTVDAVNLQAVTHCITASNTKNRSERNCYISKKAAFATVQGSAQDVNHERASMLFQDVEILGADGNLKFEDPWAASCIVAGIQAGTDVGTPATFKLINVNGIAHQDYNSKTQIELAIDAGLTPLEEVDSGGFRVVVHNTTYGKDANFVFNRVSVLAAADFVAYNLRNQLEAIFIGEKVRTGSAEAIYNTTVSIMSSFLSAELIVGDDTNDNLGWKDLTVQISGNTASVNITITPVQGIDFILATITLDNIRQSA
jgi:hypothetical protein